jgi:hypothetical protein
MLARKPRSWVPEKNVLWITLLLRVSGKSGVHASFLVATGATTGVPLLPA